MSELKVKYFDLREIDNDDINKYLIKLQLDNYINKERIEKSLSYIPEKTRKQSILANALISEELKDNAKEIYYNKKNKPLINNDLFFSISHSEDYVVFVKDSKDIGIDIEYIDLKNIDVLDYAFNDDEKDFIRTNYKNNLKEGIIKFWTIKESIYKASGIIFDIEPKDIMIDTNDLNKVVFYDEIYNILSIKIENYYLSITSKNIFDNIVLINEFSKEV